VRASVHAGTGKGHIPRWRLPWSALACLGLAAWLLVGTWMPLVHAQEEEPWTHPVLLSQGTMGIPGISARASHPVLAADMWGRVHVFWSVAFDEDATIGDTLFYSFWDGLAWSAPVDVLYTPGKPIWIPKVAVDAQGWLHVVWTDNTAGQVWYVRIPATEASSVQAWVEPIAVPAGLASGLSIGVDGAGTAHLAYCGTGEDQGVYHTSSPDGSSWSTSTYVGDTGNTASKSIECRLGLAVDEIGRLHIVWGQSFVQVAPIYYSRSKDGGRSWLPPVEVDRVDERYWELYAPGRPNILTIGPGEIHLIWFGAPAGQRWHRWSADGGDTWSPAEQIHPGLRGFMEPPGVAVDSSGTLHLASSGWIDDGPSGAFHTYWRDGHWSPLALISKPEGGSGEGGEYTALVVTGGNTLHTVGDLNGFVGIWTSSLELDAPRVPTGPPPTLEASPTAQLTPSASVVPLPTEGVAMPASEVGAAAIPSDSALVMQSSSERALVIAVLPTALLIGLVLFARLARGRIR
jgi:hypothetical protein